MNVQEFHEKIFYPVVRIRSGKASGSGTVVYSKITEETQSKEEYEQEFETYVLTNHHVIADAISVEKRYSAKLGRERKEETRSKVHVEFFNREFLSRHTGTTSVDADIVAWHEEQDVALLRLRSVRKAPFTADWYSGAKDDKGRVKDIYISENVYAVGAAMGGPPVPTSGMMTCLDMEMDNFNYWMSSAPTIFGNSGGAIFIERTKEYIGIPSRIGVVMIGFGGSAITHLSYFIPIDRLESWLKDEHYDFVFDDDKTPKQCADARKTAKEAEQRLLFSEQKDEATA